MLLDHTADTVTVTSMIHVFSLFKKVTGLSMLRMFPYPKLQPVVGSIQKGIQVHITYVVFGDI